MGSRHLRGFVLSVALLTGVACGEGQVAGEESPSPADITSIELDGGFGSNGILRVASSATEADRFVSVAVDDGRVYAAGFTTSGGDQAMAVARLSEEGALDSSFSEDGIATMNVTQGGKTGERASGMAVQSDGMVVVAGPVEHDPAASAPSDTDIAAIRFNTDGSVDTSFGTDGIVRLDLSTGVPDEDSVIGDTMYGVTLLQQDKLLLVAARAAEGGAPQRDLGIVRLNADGTRDSSFGENGVVTVDVNGGSESPRQAVELEGGEIVVAGYTNLNDAVSPVLVKLGSDGELDGDFGTNGIASAALLPAVAEAYEVGVQGEAFIITGYGRATPEENVDLIAARFSSNGEWDRTFGEDGLVRIDIAGQDDRGRDLVVLPDNRILIAGSGKPAESDQNGMLVLLDEDGNLVGDFGDRGKLQLELGGQTDSLFALRITEDRRHVIAAGWTGPEPAQGGNEDSVIVRLAVG